MSLPDRLYSQTFARPTIVAACVILVAAAGHAWTKDNESQTYHADVWSTDEGLPQSSITAIQQTRDGYLWLGTFGGLTRFDGVRFKTKDSDPSLGLSSRRILSLFEDHSGALWAGTEEGDLLRFDASKVSGFSPPSRGTATKYVRTIVETADGALWLNTAEGQLIRMLGTEFTVCSTNSNLRGATANSICVDRKGVLWVGTDEELAQYDGSFSPAWDRTREPKFSVDALARSQNGIWVAGGGRLRRFEAGKWTADYGPYPWTKGVLTCLLEDRHGQLWAGTYGSGLFRYHRDGTMLQLSRKGVLPGNFVRSLHEDREGNLWVGTEGRGLARLKPAIFTSITREDGLTSEQVLSVCEGTDGELWVGTNGEGINRLKDGRVKHYGAKDGLVNECVWSVLVDRQKQVWAGTWGGGLFRLQEDNFVPVGEPAMFSQVVCGLYEDSRSRLWLGQLWDQPAVMQLTAGRPIVFQLPTRLSRTDVRVVTEDPAGNIWIGTRGDGLYRFTGSECRRFTRDDGLISELILALYTDSQGVIWIGTRDGLNRLKDGRFTAYTTREGLVDDTICHITEDDQGHFWFGSGSGVFRVSRQELERYARGATQKVHSLGYTKADGLPSLECSSGCQPAGCKTRDGKLWFATINGLAIVDPKNVPFNPLPPPVLVEEVQIEEKDQSRVVQVPEIIGRPNALRVPPGKARFEFRYTGLSLTAPEKVRFKYKLEPLEEDWVEAGPRRTAIYSYLQPGHYLFRVLACNNDGVWNEAGATLALVLLPHFWQSWWFRALAGAVLVLIFAGIYEFRLAAERRLTRLRLRIARDLHDEVGSNLGSIALLSQVAPHRSGGGIDEVSEIRKVAVQTIDSLRDIVWFLDPANDTISDLVLRMKETARAMLPGISFQFDTTGELEVIRPSLELRRNLFPMFKEMLHNIAKHAGATHVVIDLEHSARCFRLRVSDDGKGFEENTVRLGNGLKNLRRRAAELGGVLEIKSYPGKGTSVTVQTPIT